MNELEKLNVEEALDAAWNAGWEARKRFSDNPHQGWAEVAKPKEIDPRQRAYLSLVEKMGIAIQANSQGLEAIAHALDNFQP